MIAFYAFGGGFGHLSRTRKIIDILAIDHYVILTNNARAFDFFAKDQVLLIELQNPSDKNELQKKLVSALHSIQPTQLFMDTFPSGILGELSEDNVGHFKLVIISRRMKWKQYLLEYPEADLKFAKSIIVEPLEDEHLSWLKKHSEDIEEINFIRKLSAKKEITKISKEPTWLVVHSQPSEEVDLLIEHAMDLAKMETHDAKLVVISGVMPSTKNIEWYNDENPMDWYPGVEKIITAAGFNTMKEVQPWSHKHICLPMPRRYDDQFWRKRYYDSLREE